MYASSEWKRIRARSLAAHPLCEQCRKDRCAAYQEGGIGGLRVGQRRVLRQEIKGSARDAQEDENEFIFPTAAPEPACLRFPQRYNPDPHVGQQEADGEDFGRLQSSPDKHFHADESDAPDNDDCQGQEMIEEARACHFCTEAQM